MGDLAMAGDQHDGARNLAIVDIVADPLRDPGEPVEGEPHALRGDHRKVLSDRPERPRGDDTERHEEAAQQMPIPAPTGARHWRPRLSTCDNISQTDPQKLARDPKAAAGGPSILFQLYHVCSKQIIPCRHRALPASRSRETPARIAVTRDR